MDKAVDTAINTEKTPRRGSGRRRAGRGFIIALWAIAGAMNAAAWLFPAYADAYVEDIFPLWPALYGRLTSLVSFSVGEWLLCAGAVLAAAFAAALIAALAVRLIRHTGPGPRLSRFLRFCTAVLTAVFLVMTLNCLILYHCTPLERSPAFRAGGAAGAVSAADGAQPADAAEDPTPEELASLRDEIADICNALSREVSRDADGIAVYGGTEAQMREACRDLTGALAGEFPRLAGYVVRPKPLYFSGFMSQQHMCGYYFPFSMEANYNTVMLPLNRPAAICHELAHTRGFIYEDEANFIGALACIRSDDVFMRYSGWLSIFTYVDNDLYRTVSHDEYYSHTKVEEQVRMDDLFLSDEAWEKVEKNAVLDTEFVHRAADTYVDVTLKTNGVASGRASYNGVVRLLILYRRSHALVP